jgi:hypothetical protein
MKLIEESLHIPEGDTRNSRGQRPRFNIRHETDPVRVARYDPYRVAHCLIGCTGGDAPGYCIGRFQRPKTIFKRLLKVYNPERMGSQLYYPRTRAFNG